MNACHIKSQIDEWSEWWDKRNHTTAQLLRDCKSLIEELEQHKAQWENLQECCNVLASKNKLLEMTNEDQFNRINELESTKL